jgi:hypothetical protein
MYLTERLSSIISTEDYSIEQRLHIYFHIKSKTIGIKLEESK